jgi:ParB/RepB/Spo0J family partition protein
MTPKTEKDFVTTNKDGAQFVPVDRLESEPGFNVRKDKTADKELLQSIKALGVVRPLIGRYKDRKRDLITIVDGERRYNAAKTLGLGSVPIVVYSTLDDREALALSLTSNEHQKKLTRKEMGLGFRKLHHLGFEAEQIAEIMAVEPRLVSDALKVSTKAIPAVKAAVELGVREGGIDPRVGGRVAGLPKEAQKKLAPKLAGVSREEGLEAVRKVEKKIGISRPGPRADAPKGKTFAPDAGERCSLFEHELDKMLNYSMDKKIYAREARMMLQSLQGKISVTDVLSHLNPSGKYHE